MKSRAHLQAVAAGPDPVLANYAKFFVSQQKSFVGAAATKDNDWATTTCQIDIELRRAEDGRH